MKKVLKKIFIILLIVGMIATMVVLPALSVMK